MLLPPTFAVHQLAKRLPAFHDKYPLVTLELHSPGPVVDVDEAFDAALLRDYPSSHARMVEAEAAVESLDTAQSGGGAELVEISTSKSCNRNPHSDVRVTAPDGRVRYGGENKSATFTIGPAKIAKTEPATST